MNLFSKLIPQTEEYDVTSVVPLIKHLDDRLTNLEHDVWNMKLVLKELGDKKVDLFMDHKNIHKFDSVLNNTLDSVDHIKEAKEFLRIMVENDKEEMFNSTKSAKAVKEMNPSMDDTLNHEESSERFLTELTSEHLLDIFSNKNIAKHNNFLDTLMNPVDSLDISNKNKNTKVSRVEISIKSRSKRR